jgi:hypothetical protein
MIKWKNENYFIFNAVHEFWTPLYTDRIHRFMDEMEIQDGKLIWYTSQLNAPERYAEYCDLNNIEPRLHVAVNDVYWFRLYEKYIGNGWQRPEEITGKYVCLSSRQKPERMATHLLMEHYQLIDDHEVSFGNIKLFEEDTDFTETMFAKLCKKYPNYETVFRQGMTTIKLPQTKQGDDWRGWVVKDDTDNIVRVDYNMPCMRPELFFENADFNLVMETVTDDDTLAFTEKTWRCIANGVPFFVVTSSGALKKFYQKYGFQSQEPWIDESYDNISDPVTRIDTILVQIRKLLWKDDYQDWITGLRKTADINRKICWEKYGRNSNENSNVTRSA